MITLEQLAYIMPQSTGRNRQDFIAPLNDAMERYGILTPLRIAAFLAQLAHESGQLAYVRELWGPTAAQRRYEPPSDLAKRLGNTEPGDGARFRGRGLIQITGRTNYAACSAELFGAAGVLIDEPTLLEQPEHACTSAAWFWRSRGLNELADAGRASFKEITRRINGGWNGLLERELYYDRAMKLMRLGAPMSAPAEENHP
jgi:putative chitinase